MLVSRNGVNAVLRCEVLGEGQGFVRVGDHVLVLARVGEVLDSRITKHPIMGLCYMDGTYRFPWALDISNFKEDHSSDD